MNQRRTTGKMSTSTLDHSAPTGSFGPGAESKRVKMKQFIDAVREYMPTKAENIALQINRLLQALSVTIDLSIFDPHSSVVAEFFVSLHELMSSLEQRSTIAWNCVEVLSSACRNNAARNALIHTYQFLPPLSRLLGDQISEERKIRLLTLMQELTCGIKISWQIPHLPHLMTTLTKWVESKEEQIVSLSLGVLVNLCYKNLPAIYTLLRCVDIKKLMKTCMPLKGITIEVHVCKLMIILDCLNGVVPETSYIKLIEITFKSIIEAFKAGDSILLRHSAEFFTDVLKQGQSDKLSKYDNYNEEVDRLLLTVENNELPNGSSQESECMSVLFDFLYTLIELRLVKLKQLHLRIMHLALSWIQTDIACTQALSLLRTIANQNSKEDMKVLEPLLSGLPVFLMSLNSEGDNAASALEQNRRTGALLQLLRTLTQAKFSRERVLRDLKEEALEKIFAPILSNSPRATINDTDTYSPDAINLYVYAFGLIDELAKHDATWIGLYSNLMQHKHVHMILAQALCNSPKDVKVIVLTLASARIFATENVAQALSNMQQSVHIDKPQTTGAGDSQLNSTLCYPMMTSAKIERLEEVISELKEVMANNESFNISTSSVMELYEYKLAAMGHAERAAMASVEAASQRCTHLEHRTAQLTAELTKLHQLLFHKQQCLEDAVKVRDSLRDNNKQLENKLEAEKGKLKVISSQLKVKEKNLSEAEAALEEWTKKSKELSAHKASLTQQNDELKKIIVKLEENLRKKEKLVEKREENLSRVTTTCEVLKTQNAELESVLERTEKELSQKTQEVESLLKEVEQKRSIISTITKVATSEM